MAVIEEVMVPLVAKAPVLPKTRDKIGSSPSPKKPAAKVHADEDEEDHGLKSRRRTLKRMAIEEEEEDQVEETKSKGLKRSKPETIDPEPSPEKRKMVKLDDDNNQIGSQRAARLS
jgi:hypothetical protein